MKLDYVELDEALLCVGIKKVRPFFKRINGNSNVFLLCIKCTFESMINSLCVFLIHPKSVFCFFEQNWDQMSKY